MYSYHNFFFPICRSPFVSVLSSFDERFFLMHNPSELKCGWLRASLDLGIAASQALLAANDGLLKGDFHDAVLLTREPDGRFELIARLDGRREARSHDLQLCCWRAWLAIGANDGAEDGTRCKTVAAETVENDTAETAICTDLGVDLRAIRGFAELLVS